MAQPEPIENHEKEIVQFTEKETEIINEMHRLDFELNLAKKKASSLKNEISELIEKANENEQLSLPLKRRSNKTKAMLPNGWWRSTN